MHLSCGLRDVLKRKLMLSKQIEEKSRMSKRKKTIKIL